MNWTETISNTSARGCLPFEETTHAKAVKTISYAVLVIASLIGNSATIVVIFKVPRMRTTTNCLIANMAVSDLLLPIFAMPRTISEVYLGTNRWLIGGGFGLALCKLTPLFQDVSTAVSIQSLVSIAAERFYNVFYPVEASMMRLRVLKVIIPITWVTAFFIHSPYLYTFKIIIVNDQHYCILNWSPLFDNRKAQQVYFVLVIALLYGIPLCVIAVLYTAIIARLKNQQFPSQHQTENTRRVREKRNRSILQLSVVTVVAFVICWTPIVTYALWRLFTSPTCGHENALFAVTFIAHSISGVNPFIYFLFSSSYRKGLAQVFHGVSRVFPTVGIEQPRNQAWRRNLNR